MKNNRQEGIRLITLYLKWAIFFNSLIVIFQAIVGNFTNRSGLLSSAARKFTGTSAFILSNVTLLQTLKKPTMLRTFGFHHSSILAAFLN
ncbi:MAG: hypothetical protein ACHQYP_09365, partial [Nitrospiria bacterium]